MKKIFSKILGSKVVRKDKDLGSSSGSYLYSKDINEDGIDIVVDLDIIFNSLRGSYFLSSVESMSVNKGILDLIGFFRKANDCNTHIFYSGKKDNTFILDKVLSSGFSINSICSHPYRKMSSKFLDASKLLSLLELLCSFSKEKEHKVIFILASMEELYFINIIRNYILGKLDESSFSSSYIYKMFSSYVNFSDIKNINIKILAVFLLKQDPEKYTDVMNSIINEKSLVCVFDNYLDIGCGLFVSNFIDKECFLSFLKYAHNHLGEDIDNILDKISILKSNGILVDSDVEIFNSSDEKCFDKKLGTKKQYPISNYMIEEGRDFSSLLQKGSLEFLQEK